MKCIIFIDILKSSCKANGKTKSQVTHISSEKVSRGGSSLVLSAAQLPHNLSSAIYLKDQLKSKRKEEILTKLEDLGQLRGTES